MTLVLSRTRLTGRLFTMPLMLLMLAIGSPRAQWVATSGPGSSAGRTEALLGNGSYLYAATNGGGVFRSDDQGTIWKEVNTGLGIYKSVLCLSAIDATLFAGTNGGVYASTDNGDTWTIANTGVTNSPRSFCLKGSDLFVATYGGGVFRSSNKGGSWTPVVTGLTDLLVQALTVSGTSLFAGNHNGQIFRSSDNGDSWTQVRVGSSDDEVMALAAIDSSIFVATNSNGVFVSTNNGDTWTAANTGGNFGTRALAVSDTHLFLGTGSQGVYHSTDKAAKWTQEKDGLTDKDIQSITAFGPNIYAGTIGKVWRRPLSELGVVTQLVSTPAPKSSDWMDGIGGVLRQGDVVRFRLGAATRVNLGVYTLDGVRVKTLFQGALAQGEHAATMDTRGLAAGVHLLQLETGGQRSARRVLIQP